LKYVFEICIVLVTVVTVGAGTNGAIILFIVLKKI
jgi:hypothetical protein